MNRSIVKYRVLLALKRAGAFVAGLAAPRPPADAPEVTVVLVSYNTRYATELALRTLRQHTRYPARRIWVFENASTDGSVEALRGLREELGFELVESETAELHSHWLDYAMRHVQTPYWACVDSDIVFLGPDWLYDLVGRLERDPSCYVLSAEPVPGGVGVEPVGGATVEAGEQVSSWLFAVRTSLRERVDSSFAFHHGDTNPETGHERVYDTGGKILHDLRAQGLGYGAMPRWYRAKYHHFQSLSWAFRHDLPAARRTFKLRQLSDIERWVQRLRRREGPRTAVTS